MTPNDRKFFRPRVIVPLLVAIFAILLLPGASFYYSYSGGKSCTKCHEIWQPYRDWHESAHRNIACSECHGDVLTLDAGFHLKNIRQLAAHIRGKIPEQVRLKTDDVFKIGKRCEKCHREEYASWSSGPHSTTYSKIFLSKDHNSQTLLMDNEELCAGRVSQPLHQSLRSDPGRESGQQGAEQQYSQDQRKSHCRRVNCGPSLVHHGMTTIASAG